MKNNMVIIVYMFIVVYIRLFKLCVFECMINLFILKSFLIEKDIECIVNIDC